MCPPAELMPSDKPPCMQLSEPTTFLSAHTRDGLGHEQMLDNRPVFCSELQSVWLHTVRNISEPELLLNPVDTKNQQGSTGKRIKKQKKWFHHSVFFFSPFFYLVNFFYLLITSALVTLKPAKGCLSCRSIPPPLTRRNPGCSNLRACTQELLEVGKVPQGFLPWKP